MEPFFSGMAIGIAIGVPLFIVIVAGGLLYAAIVFCRQFYLAARAGIPAARSDCRRTASAIRRRAIERNRRQLAWMEQRRGFRSFAHLYRRLLPDRC
jgi:hypothetical protein